MNKPKIVILTPVKDEAWILGRFLLAASEVADHILVLDQQSEDESRAICARFPKVVVIDNPGGDYSEAARSRLLLEGARKIFGPGNVLIALDADEIISGNSLHSNAWDSFRDLPHGTVLYFEKPEMLPHPARCIRQTNWFPLGLVDDGAPHEGKVIHSHRLPVRAGALSFFAADICAMHFARLRPVEFAVRQAYYCMLENVNRTRTHRVRSCCYSPLVFTRFGDGKSDCCPKEWFDWFEAKGVDLWSYETKRYNTFHIRALRLFAEHRSTRFTWDDIWWEDWEAARRYFYAQNIQGIPDKPLRRPTRFVQFLTLQMVRFYLMSSKMATLIRSFIVVQYKPVMHV